MDTKKMLQNSLEDYYKGQVAKYKANLSVLLSMHVGLAEHPDIIETLDEQFSKLAEADEKLEMLRKHFYRELSSP